MGLEKILGMGPVRSQYRDQQAQFLKQMGNQSGAFQNRLGRSTSAVNRFDPMYQAAVRARVNTLQQDPYASEQDALTLASAAGRNADQYGVARGNLARMLARRGIGGGIEAGALGNLEAARMGDMAQARTQTALARLAQRNANQQEAVGLLGGVNQYYTGQEGANLAGLTGLYGNLSSGYGNLAAQDEAAQMAARQQMMGLIGGAASAFGGNMGMGARPQISQGMTPYQEAPPPAFLTGQVGSLGAGYTPNVLATGGYDDPYAPRPRRWNFMNSIYRSLGIR